MIIAHRANDNIHRENSIEAILNSLSKYYVDGIEIDVRLTKDNKLILNHDPFYKGKLIKKENSKKLRQLGLNTLSEVLNKIKTNKIIMIEIKCDNNIKRISKVIIKTISKYNLNIYICSFNYKLLKYLKENYKIKCGLIIGIKINTKYINNEFDFNSINYLCNKLSNKETFKWTVNKLDNIKNKNDNFITDNCKLIYDFIKKP